MISRITPPPQIPRYARNDIYHFYVEMILAHETGLSEVCQ